MLLDKMHEEPYVLHGIPEGTNQEIRVSITGHKGRAFVDLRRFVRNGVGAMFPTAEGITLPLDQLAELEMAVAKLYQVVDHVKHTPHLG